MSNISELASLTKTMTSSLPQLAKVQLFNFFNVLCNLKELNGWIKNYMKTISKSNFEQKI